LVANKRKMSQGSTRRDFLKTSGWAVAAGALSVNGTTLSATPKNAPTAGEIAVWVTSGNQRFARIDPVTWRSTSGPSDNAIVLNPQKTAQEILGFGAAFTDAACFMFNQLSPAAREHLFHELFHPSEMGLSVCRTCIGSSDYSIRAYSYDDGDTDLELARFSIAHDREYILPMLRLARQANADLFLFSSPWSPPGWMKSGGSLLGGSMRHKYLPQYAQYFLKFLQAYASEEYEIDFVGRQLGPLLEKHNVPTKIWILDHNYNLWGRAVCELDDPDLRKYCKAVAWHGYYGTPEMMSKVQEAHPDAEMYWTEGGPDYTSPDYLTDWAKWGVTFTAALRNWCRGLTGWESGSRRTGSSEYRSVPLWRHGHDSFADQGNHAQRAILGIRALFPSHSPRCAAL
jgi:glucosylceramidase